MRHLWQKNFDTCNGMSNKNIPLFLLADEREISCPPTRARNAFRQILHTLFVKRRKFPTHNFFCHFLWQSYFISPGRINRRRCDKRGGICESFHRLTTLPNDSRGVIGAHPATLASVTSAKMNLNILFSFF